MNPISLLAGFFVFFVFATTSAMIWWGAKRNSTWSAARRKMVCGSLFVGAIIMGILAFFNDSQQRAGTLFEIVFDWENTPEKVWLIDVENAGVEHTVYVVPRRKPYRRSYKQVTLRFRLLRDEGNAIFDETLELRTQPSKVWKRHSFTFVPYRAGAHRLEIDSIVNYPPKLFIRIEDPLKKDGKRAAGY